MKRHILVIDPIPFAGGSKVATLNILRLLDPDKTRITVLTSDIASWNETDITHQQLHEHRLLNKLEQGVGYFLRHLLIALQILQLRLRFGAIDIAIGASGPGVDLALYLAKPLLGYRIIQLVHGPVARSRTIARCLQQADHIHYLESSRASLINALTTVTATNKLSPSRFSLLQNGLAKKSWPTPCQMNRPVIFWAASLLKWKGLEILLNALKQIEPQKRAESHICYIRPKETSLSISSAPVAIDEVQWHHEPTNLDKIRSSANIFVSTSTKEPFGLSILEAMAAGHCIVIPADGAYWDRTLEDNIECIKYKPNDSDNLAEKLIELSQNMQTVRQLGLTARNRAEHYRAEKRLKNVINNLEGTRSSQTVTPLNSNNVQNL